MNNAQLVIDEVKKAVKGKDDCIIKAFAAFLAGGHILLEDVPGVGKTTLAVAFSRAMALVNHRVQFTPDVLPADILGFSMYQKQTGEFVYREGAVMCNLFLADEINRTSPKTQSALLEVMEEGNVTVDGISRKVPEPFIVMATQNPKGSAGTQLLPESQLDRFMICMSMGYPSHDAEVDIAKGKSVKADEYTIKPVMNAQGLVEMQGEVEQVFIHDSIYSYIVDLVDATRTSPYIELGVSPRGTIACVRMAKAYAYLSGRSYVIPSDVVSVFADVTKHRIVLNTKARVSHVSELSVIDEILKAVKQPTTYVKKAVIVISFLIGIITAAIVFYMSMIYGNAALALLGCFMCVFMVLTFIALLVKAHRAVAAINIPIAIATQGESIRVSLSCRLKEAGFDGVKYRVTVKNNLSGEKSTKWLSGGSDFLYSVNLCGNYEFELVRIKLYDFSRLFYVTKRVKKYANVEVMPQIDEIPVRITDRVRNFFGDSDIYDDLRPGYDPSELFDVREFQNGDRLQSVHWKLSARTDELMVKENSLPKACAVAIVADLRGIKKGRQADAFMKLLVSLSFSLMDQKCSHYVAWYDTAINDIVRARVDDEEGFYIFLNSFLKIKPDTKNDALFLYEEKYRAEKLVCLLSVDGRLQIKRGEEIVGRADEKNEIVI
ncbi:Uncharacterized conserved protein (some members contain a von Willebrand factor type A (vWA) domain) [Agathobacter rectalis]|uniref:Uncharacterized conserved protein (Some members contain a von Willebrand factor type A (VWA) domain) n=5 Tax=Agathobacter TaxID=1766253 RepID=A0A173ZJZ6_9FIRM|nr:AAA family ATPase [Agathobacter rectalis]CUN75548.1 Uncharacterized conserved protein (some members contain a von Willebrand factor type A (vWA) domain) [Agathobacter rectalis]